jgi:hypothetical protein
MSTPSSALRGLPTNNSMELAKLPAAAARPGTSVPPKFAETIRMERLKPIARKFPPTVLEMDDDDCLVTDESSLWDFHVEESNEVFNDRIRAHFDVDVSDFTDARLCEILERIQARHRSA